MLTERSAMRGPTGGRSREAAQWHDCFDVGLVQDVFRDNGLRSTVLSSGQSSQLVCNTNQSSVSAQG